MNDHQLGHRLRHQILADLQRGQAADGRRLQAVLGDLCGNDHQSLLPALRHLVMGVAFRSAVEQQPPLPADPRLQLRLQQELEPIFTSVLCQRMGTVLQGLLDLPETAASRTPSPAMPAAPTQPIAAATPHQSGLVAVLGFMAGVLVVGVVGGLAWLLLLAPQPQGSNHQPTDRQTPPSSSTTPGPDAQPTEAPPPPPDLGAQSGSETAMASIEQLYADISSGNLTAARQRFAPEVADQFDPTFFSQFQSVRVSDLQESGRSGSSILLNGVVTFTYPDGSSQSESRSFTVDTASQPAKITGSSFGAVLKPRG